MFNPFHKARLYQKKSSLYARTYPEKKVDLRALYEKYTHWPLRKSGRAYVGRCPFHDDHSPSLALYLDTNSVYCFSCKFSAKGSWFEKKLKEL